MEPGDVVLVRTGYGSTRRSQRGRLPAVERAERATDADPLPHLPGLSAASLPWFRHHDVAVVGSDTGTETRPAEHGWIAPFHVVAMCSIGMWILDNFELEDLADACTVIRRLWTSAEPFDFHGTHLDLTGAFGSPKPVQQPHPPILVAGRSAGVLRVAAEHADIWNIAGGDISDAAQRSALLDRYCTEIGRDPAAVTRSIHLGVSYEQPDTTRLAISEALDAGFRHITLGLPQPYPAGVARWVADELIAKSA